MGGWVGGWVGRYVGMYVGMYVCMYVCMHVCMYMSSFMIQLIHVFVWPLRRRLRNHDHLARPCQDDIATLVEPCSGFRPQV